MTMNKRRIAYLFTLLLLTGNFGPVIFAMQQGNQRQGREESEAQRQ